MKALASCTEKQFEHIRNGNIDPASGITHCFTLDQATKAYEMFRNKEGICIKAALKP